MHEMEESVRSGGIVKKKSSSGCLIIKKKGDVSGGVVVGSSTLENQRPRLVMSDSGSSEDALEHVKRKANEHARKPPIVYGRRTEEQRELRRNGEIMESERKRSRLDLFDFDEYDEFDGKGMRIDYSEMVSGSSRGFVGGSGFTRMTEKSKHSYFDGSRGEVRGRSKAVDLGGRSRPDLDADEAHLPISLLRLKYQNESAEPIRLQGKNGVLKVMVNKKKNVELSSRKNYDRQEFESKKGSKSEDFNRKESSVPPPFYSDSKRPDKQTAFAESEESLLKPQKPLQGKSNNVGEKSELKIQKPLLGKSTKAEDYDSDGTDTALELGPPSLEAGSSREVVKHEVKRSLTPENVTPVKARERKVISPAENVTPLKGVEGKLKQRGGSTEKQLLRERIRDMLMKAGWTIDYRPRKNRDYLDAVYINPSGTAYWSIIKAYDALQKQLEEDDEGKPNGGSSSFAPLSDDLINKLTRQTRKKIEQEMKRKRRDGGLTKKSKKTRAKKSNDDADSGWRDERLSSFIMQNGKPKKGRIREVICEEGDDDLSDDSYGENPEEERGQKPTTTSSIVVQGRQSKKIGRCTLLIRSSEKGQNSESDGYIPYTGKRTLLAWLIDTGSVQLSEKVQYMNRRRSRVKLEGWITKDGIHCGCCSKILTVSKFELHAGSKLRQPFQNIILESGSSLLQCLVNAWNKQEESMRRDFYVVDVDGDDPDDDTCGICCDGGDLICCDGCPSTFHQNCLGIQVLPPGDWHCPNCTCKFCGTASHSPTNENSATLSELTMCILCEKKYHKSCTEGMVASIGNANNSPVAFCGKKCQELCDHLQKILGIKHELEAGFSWSLLQRTDLESDTASKGFPQRVESNSKLAVALSVMDECFLPIIDRRSGINLIHNVLYNCGSNFSRLNFHGFFTMILERGDEIISSASIRIHGPQVAEMPFIGTRNIYRRQGMCRRLLSAIESVLCSLKVERLVIPAISEHMHTWSVVFGFRQLQLSDKKKMKSLNMLVFPATDMLQKQLLKQECPGGIKGSHSKGNPPQSPASIEKGNPESPMEQDLKIPLQSQLAMEIDKSSGSPAGLPGCPHEIESSALDSATKYDDPSSVENSTSHALKINVDAPLSGSLLDFPGKTSNHMVEDAGEDWDPPSVPTARDADKNSMQSQQDQLVTMVITDQGDRDSSAKVVDGEAVLNSDVTHTVPGFSKVTSSENGDENVSSKQSVALESQHCCNGDTVLQSKSDLNSPVVIVAQKDLHVSSEALDESKAASDITFDPCKVVSAVSVVNNVATEVIALHSETDPPCINEASSKSGLEDIRKHPDATSSSQCADAQATPYGAILSCQNKLEFECSHSIASTSDYGLDIAPVNSEGHSSNISEYGGEESPIFYSSAKKSPQLAAEGIQGSSDGNSESCAQLSPKLIRRTTLVLEDGMVGVIETLCNGVGGSGTVVETEEANEIRGTQKAETIPDSTDPAHGSPCASLVQNGTEPDQRE